MKATKSAGGVVVNTKTGKIVIVNQHGRSWSLPKGHVEDGEKEIDAAVREIGEETGISNLKTITKLGTYERHRIGRNPSEQDKNELKRITIFLFLTDDEALSPQDADNPEARWVSFGAAVEMLTHPKDRDFLLTMRKEIKKYTS